MGMTKDVVINKNVQKGAPLGFVLFVAYIGAAVYFINQTSGFWNIIWALIKAIVWPGIIVYHVMQMLHV